MYPLQPFMCPLNSLMHPLLAQALRSVCTPSLHAARTCRVNNDCLDYLPVHNYEAGINDSWIVNSHFYPVRTWIPPIIVPAALHHQAALSLSLSLAGTRPVWPVWHVSNMPGQPSLPAPRDCLGTRLLVRIQGRHLGSWSHTVSDTTISGWCHRHNSQHCWFFTYSIPSFVCGIVSYCVWLQKPVLELFSFLYIWSGNQR